MKDDRFKIVYRIRYRRQSNRRKSVHPNGFEPLTFGSVDRCSIQLSYGCARVALAARLIRDIVTQGSAFGKRGLGFLD